MYKRKDMLYVEDVCLEQNHIDKVWKTIEQNLPRYFAKYIDTNGGVSTDNKQFDELQAKFGIIRQSSKKKSFDQQGVLRKIMNDSINDFLSDQDEYLLNLDLECFEEYEDDPKAFKGTIFRDKLPIIRHTLNNKMAKELDQYRKSFALADSWDLCCVMRNILEKAKDFSDNIYDYDDYKVVDTIEDLDEYWFEFDTDNKEEALGYEGVIGGGIRSHILYKMYPKVYPNRNQDAVWALYFLSDKQKFGCKEDSEFIVIDRENRTIEQNYFYLYQLFTFYATKISNFLEKEFGLAGIDLDVEYRFVFVNDFLNFVTLCNQDQVDTLKHDPQNHYSWI